jgi:glycosyltransferase involved in cell wall biosynthesis
VIRSADDTGPVSSEPAVEISIIVPAYNEAQGITGVLTTLNEVAAQSGLDVEILVVDDGSQDGTAEVVRRIPNIRVLSHPRNHGYGAALKTGIRNARGRIVCLVDADGTYPCAMIPQLVRQARAGADMVVGARIGENVKIPRNRVFAKWVIGQFANSVAGCRIPDINSGLRVIDRSVVLRFLKLLPDGFSFTTTITLGMLSNGYRVDYVPIDYHQRIGRSKIRPIRDTLNFVQLIFRIGLYFTPLKIFFTLGAMIALLGIAWGTFTAVVLGQLADVSTVIIMMTALQVWMLGLLAELINRRSPDYSRDDL